MFVKIVLILCKGFKIFWMENYVIIMGIGIINENKSVLLRK